MLCFDLTSHSLKKGRTRFVYCRICPYHVGFILRIYDFFSTPSQYQYIISVVYLLQYMLHIFKSTCLSLFLLMRFSLLPWPTQCVINYCVRTPSQTSIRQVVHARGGGVFGRPKERIWICTRHVCEVLLIHIHMLHDSACVRRMMRSGGHKNA